MACLISGLQLLVGCSERWMNLRDPGIGDSEAFFTLKKANVHEFHHHTSPGSIQICAALLDISDYTGPWYISHTVVIMELVKVPFLNLTGLWDARLSCDLGGPAVLSVHLGMLILLCWLRSRMQKVVFCAPSLRNKRRIISQLAARNCRSYSLGLPTQVFHTGPDAIKF